jgi:spore maturation protein SpmB
MTLWLRIGYEWIVEGVYVGSSGYAKLYLQNLTTGGAKTLIGTTSATTVNTWTKGTYNISSVYTAAGVYGLTVELSCGVTIQAIGAPRSVRAKAQVSDIQAIF